MIVLITFMQRVCCYELIILLITSTHLNNYVLLTI